MQPQLQPDDGEGGDYAERGTEERLTRQRVIVPTRPGQRDDDQTAEQDEPHEEAFRARGPGTARNMKESGGIERGWRNDTAAAARGKAPIRRGV